MVVKSVFMFLEYKNIILLRGCMDEVKITKSSLLHTSKTETSRRTMSGFTRENPKHSQEGSVGQCPYFESCPQRLDSWDSSIYIFTPPTALSSWLPHFFVERVYPLHSKSLNSLLPRASIQSSLLGIEWSKDSRSLCDSPPQTCLSCWIFIFHASYFWSFAPKWLEVVLELPLGVMSLGKFVLSFFVIVSSSRVSWWLLERGNGWERSSFLWTHQRGRRILCEFKLHD
jgi:hypothetical protein